jgi:RNA polymerase sigma factor (sigma-70 family)
VEVEDLEQVSYFALLDAMRAYDPERGYSFLTWLGFPLRNRFNELTRLRAPGQRKDSTLTPVSLDEPVPGTDIPIVDTLIDPMAEEAFRRVEDADEFRLTIESLPETQREVMRLRIGEELSYQEIADVCSMTHAAVKSNLTMGMERLRRKRGN